MTAKISDLTSYCKQPIYLGKPVRPRFGQMVRKIHDWQILPWNCVYHLYKSVPFNEKRPRRPETGIKDGLEDMEHEFPFGIRRPGKTGLPFQMFRCSRKFSAETRPKKTCTIYILTGFSRNFW